jgi:tetratricopeptide (TPR) repeat protein
MTRVRFILLAALLLMVALTTLSGCRSAHTTSAILYIDEQNYDKAVQVIHDGFQFSDDEPDAYYYLGEAYSHLAEEAVQVDDFPDAQKNLELAYEAYTRAREIDAEHFEEEVTVSLKHNYTNRMRQAKLDWDENYYEQAEGHMRLAFASLPDSLSPIKSIARMKMQMANDTEFAESKNDLLLEALGLLDTVLDAKPEAYELRANKANVLAALERNAEARQIYDELLSEHGDDTDLLIDIATLALDEDDFARSADFYVRVVDLREADTDASNDDQNKEMLLAAGTWYSMSTIGRYDEALVILDRAADMEIFPLENTILTRLRTYYNYGTFVKKQSDEEVDLVAKAELLERSKTLFTRAAEIGVAMTNNFVANADGFLYLSLAQVELGDYAASEANYKTYNELQGAGGS